MPTDTKNRPDARNQVQNKSKKAAVMTKNVAKAVGRTPTRSVRIATVRKKEKTPFPTGIVFTSIMVTVLILYTIINYAEINTIKSDIAAMRSNITTLQKNEAKLQNQLNLKYSEADIDRVATEELGMVKSSELERIYIDITNGDKTEIVEHEETGLSVLLSSFGEVLKKLFE